jgi:hypothetical protein
VWYNDTSNALKFQYPNIIGAWATTNSLNTARYASGGAGTQTSALVFGGEIGPNSAATESYNGTNWTEVNDLSAALAGVAGCGASNTSALAFGGETSPGPQVATTQSWNGTNWTDVNSMNTARYALGGSGIQTSALAYGGQTPVVANTELWNGTNWTEVNDLGTAKFRVGNAGADNTSALCFGGRNAPGTRYADTELWNGTNWTEINNLNQAKDELGSSGIATAALAFGGNVPPGTANTEEWNGVSWVEVNNLSNVTIANTGGTGTTDLSLNAGGIVGGSASAISEEWNASTPVGAWATQANMNTAREVNGAGTVYTAALAFGYGSAVTELWTRS